VESCANAEVVKEDQHQHGREKEKNFVLEFYM